MATVSADSGRNSGNPRRPVYRMQKRDLEEELLNFVSSQFQINCCQRLPLAEIFGKMQNTNAELTNFVKNDVQRLRCFLLYYRENFSFDSTKPDIVVRNFSARLASKSDKKEKRRVERLAWMKSFDEGLISQYDLVFDDSVLRFVLALFVRMKDCCLRMTLVETAVKQAFREDIEIIDYISCNVGKFLAKRDYLFYEQYSLLVFKGAAIANAAYALNEELRERLSTPDADADDQTVVPSLATEDLRKYFVETYVPTISENARSELSFYTSRDGFISFVGGISWVFLLSEDNGRVLSRRSLPPLPWKHPLKKSFLPIVAQFGTVHPKWTDFQSAPLDIDDLDKEFTAPLMTASVVAKKSFGMVKKSPTRASNFRK